MGGGPASKVSCRRDLPVLQGWCEGSSPVKRCAAFASSMRGTWFERETYDLYGVLFSGHSDKRRILTDYGVSWRR